MKIVEYGNMEGKRILCIPGVFMAAECFRRLSQELPEYRLAVEKLPKYVQRELDRKKEVV